MPSKVSCRWLPQHLEEGGLRSSSWKFHDEERRPPRPLEEGLPHLPAEIPAARLKKRPHMPVAPFTDDDDE